MGSMSAQWEHFNEWKKISDEQEKGVVSLETMIRGTCEKSRLLDLMENFVLFSDAGGAPIKLVAKNHQLLESAGTNADHYAYDYGDWPDPIPFAFSDLEDGLYLSIRFRAYSYSSGAGAQMKVGDFYITKAVVS